MKLLILKRENGNERIVPLSNVELETLNGVHRIIIHDFNVNINKQEYETLKSMMLGFESPDSITLDIKRF